MKRILAFLPALALFAPACDDAEIGDEGKTVQINLSASEKAEEAAAVMYPDIDMDITMPPTEGKPAKCSDGNSSCSCAGPCVAGGGLCGCLPK